MRTLLNRAWLLLMPLLFFSHDNSEPQSLNEKIAIPYIEISNTSDSLQLQIDIYKSGIKMNLEEIKMIRGFKEQPYRVLE